MNELINQNVASPSVDEMQKEIRALKRKLALLETNLSRAKLISSVQERVETVLSASYKKELQFFNLVLENATNILLLLDFDGRFAYASRTFLSEAGLPNFGMINGRHFYDVLQPIIAEESLRRFANAVDKAICDKSTITLEEQLDFSFKGTPRTFSIFVTPMTDEDNSKITGIMALFNDITEINDAMETAKRANLAKSDFLANMSHEIRTPLNAIVGMSAIAQNSEDIDKISYCLDKIGDSSKHLLGIINDILDMSKIEANHFELSYSEFAFEKMLLRIIDLMRFKIEEKSISFDLYCDPAIPYSIYSDEQRLAQVIMNLMSNAVKFTPEHGSISIRAEVESIDGDDCTLRISVKDSGIGIAEEQKPRLFKAFSQADSSISRKFGGTGLGLAISKSIINLLDGDIWFESPGSGTVFIFNIKTIVRKQNPVINPDEPKLCILAADKSPAVLERFSLYSQKLGLSCELAESAEKALSILQDRPCDIIFIDWEMTEGCGLSLVKQFGSLASEPLITAMVSTTDWSEIEKDAKSAGVKEFVSKPILLPVIEQIKDKRLESMSSKKERALDDFSGKTILLVDDIPINREIVSALLEDTGITIVDADNGVEAVNAFTCAPESFDLIFMDVQMPEMDGYEASRRIRQFEAERQATNVPIIAMTANVFKEDIERCHASGMNDHIGKPINFEEILEKMNRWING